MMIAKAAAAMMLLAMAGSCTAHAGFAPTKAALPLPLMHGRVAVTSGLPRSLAAASDAQARLPQLTEIKAQRAATLSRVRSMLAGALLLALPRGAALASAGLPASIPAVPLSRPQLLTRLALWGVLFSMAALLAGAETAITTLWPWKVKQLAAEEGDDSPFSTLQTDVTKVLGTVLIGVTFCTIFGTALATDVAVGLFGKAGVGYATVAITLVTLFFGEIFPKSLAVAKPEALARFTLPMINAVTFLLTPLSWLTSVVTNQLLAALGTSKEDSAEAVTKPELRLVLSSASESGAVELYEQDMIEGVLDLQRTQVQQVMTPRVELVAVGAGSTLTELLAVALRTKYSRVPVYNETVDQIVGIVLTRELLTFNNASMTGASTASSERRQLAETPVESIMEGVSEASLFVPESMTVMNALKQMRRQRLHMMVVVDEFGGTSGIVTLEDILETLVGEIYDEDDEEEVVEDTSSIVQAMDGSYTIDGMADLDIVCERLGLTDDVDPEILAEFATLSGFLCHVAGEIPAEGDVLLAAGMRFDVVEADERRLLSVKACNMSAGMNVTKISSHGRTVYSSSAR